MEDEPELGSSSTSKILTFSELADEYCAYYMSIGVPYHEFWYGDYTQLSFYHSAHEMKRERSNYDAWLQGNYFYDALCAVSPVFHAFAKAGTKPQPYHKEPYGAKKEDKQEREDVDAKVGAAKFFAFASQFNKKFE